MNRLDRAAAGARAADRVIARMDEQEARDRETMRKDFEWSIYRECDREDAEEEARLAPTEAERAVDKVLANHRIVIHDAPLGEVSELPLTPTVIAGEVAQYDPAPECTGVIATRESLESEGPMAAVNGGFRGAQNGLTAGETAHYLVEFMRVQQAANGIAAKESK